MGKAAIRWWLWRTVGGMMLKDLLQFKWLEGHRTQVAAIIIAALTLALNLGWIDQKTYASIVGFLTGIGLLTAAAHRPPSN